MNISLAQRDIYLLEIDSVIRDKKKLLVNKKKDLEKKCKINEYLSSIQNDYLKYYNYIRNEKQEQYNSLLLLNEYMNELIKAEDLVDEQLRIAKHDQKYIIQEIDKIKTELDELIE